MRQSLPGSRLHWRTGSCAHGYLLSQFLSPRTTPKHGARSETGLAPCSTSSTPSLQGRSCLSHLRETQQRRLSKAASTLPIASAAAWLQEASADMLEISGGTYEQPRLLGAEGGGDRAQNVPASTVAREAYFRGLCTGHAEEISISSWSRAASAAGTMEEALQTAQTWWV